MPNHEGIPVWEVEIPVFGLVKIQRRFSLITRKELNTDEPFYSDIYIEPKNYGFLIRLGAYAPDENQARIAGLVFLGRMLDVLSLNCNLSVAVHESQFKEQVETINVKRVIDREDFRNAFHLSRKLILKEPTFLRALGWFRKGKYTTDPLDKFLAYWNSIETVASKYNPNKQACRERGSICHIWECFKSIWGDNCYEWPLITNNESWIDKGNTFRKNIAHGVITTEIESVASIVEMSFEVEVMSRKFLLTWFQSLDLSVDNHLME